MKRFVAAVAGVFAVHFGGSQLLLVLPWAAIQDPKLHLSGSEYVR
jgi:hypothetical protein